MGVTPREEEILDLHEQRIPPDEIARRMGISESYVRARIGTLSGNGSDRAWNDMVRMGTAKLGEAIQRYHSERCR